ncbi:putative mitochondrial protein [Cucumis melo var. makuwa]|uniref:Mitochondrial protein n=1 Tax=Cucumis melo var. makuwa TaxID=1194695 RepID=A0A5A7UHH0_CUCMM|nr:putative mitochondrial protein [Cucumis melo var. makuwa]TYK27548.1 putative mitochondrial protein [Cucumis melo var. makuwa]
MEKISHIGNLVFSIKTLDGKAWRALVYGYEPPMVIVDGVSVPKPEVDWIDAEEQASVGNARAINAIFNGVDLNVFKLINSYTTAKEAWKILEVAYEGTSKVKISRLQLITSKFEALRMTEDESVSIYNGRVLEIANDSLLLGEKIPESKIVRKVLRSLPRKFDMHEGTDNLYSILNSGQNGVSKYGLGFDASMQSAKSTSEVRFVPASVKTEQADTTVITNTPVKSFRNVCHSTKEDQTWLWHRKLGHINLESIDRAVKNEAVIGVPKIDVNIKFVCGDCQIGKKTKASHKSLKEFSTNRVLELLHMDLMGPMQSESLGGKKYVLVAVNDFSRFTSVRFLRGKSDIPKVCMSLCLKLQREKGNSRAYRVFNNRTEMVMEIINVVVDDYNNTSKQIDDKEDEASEETIAPTSTLTVIKQRSEGIFISQEKYAKNIVKKFGLDQSQYKRTPAVTHAKITKDIVGIAVDHKLYRSMIGSLLYLTASRPNIAYAVGICARYQSDSHISHLNAVKRIIKYVHGTTYFEILYSYDTSSELVGYCDADWAGSADDRKSTFGGCFFLGNNLVS